MWRATFKGLLAHKVRLGLTALAIVLGVGFVSGTYILTDTMNKAFQNLFSTIDKGIAVQVSGGSKFKGGSGGDVAVTVLVEGPSVRARIVGIFGFRNGATNLAGATVVAFDPATAQRVLGGHGSWDTIDVAAKQGVSPSDLRDRIQRILPRGFQAKTGEQAAQENADQLRKGLSFFNIALLVFAGVALFVGAFIIFNTLDRKGVVWGKGVDLGGRRS